MTEQIYQSISEKNIKTVQKVYAAFAIQDFDTILNLLSDNVVWSEPPNPFNPAAGTRYGHTGFLEWLKIGRASEEILAIEPRQFLVGENSVAVAGWTKCRAKPTNKTYETDFVHLFSFKEDKIILFREFFDTYIAGEAFKM